MEMEPSLDNNNKKRKIEAQSNVKYIPPALRHHEESGEDYKKDRLKKQLKGLLNRFAITFIFMGFHFIKKHFFRNLSINN